ncbi:hypothetical protein IO99_17290 [Clostridium sulfidigenes]|uniref:Uncharacterized protein n=1 Tax=Clostridium sulfidigenes TaxID=318464 RepID=A0A084J7T8_9CLOT|nr:hypothetical protein [Clostridium sulfidigenes]KEZ85022.1 hypothetical protein IO99_17290 [Clostridium sulfidigenes]
MNRKGYSVIIILYTIVNIIALVSFNISNENLDYKEENKVIAESNEKVENYNKEITTGIEKENMDANTSRDLIKNNGVNETIVSDEELKKRRIQADRERQNQLNKIYKSDNEIVKIDEIEFDKYNKQVKEKNKVMKVPPEELIDELTISEKAKIIGICKDLNEEDYSEINEFLTYNNERLAVLRTLNVIERKVNEEQIEELKKIFSKYIDMDKVEGN